ncbi:RHS repeat-associated core domain-containing protein [Pseudomonas sp. C32]|uniref:RHS repeat-associated core domain-containing protein n=1 Tax=Pseudomonas sp. C32 TaxID=1529208 RepID=UPI002612FC3B|nr:RHS repeat-associated core domain-containing protein [Pseudomonas sp. C32]MDN4546493.1 RHS repeat-associated core domain-containing protein [Pseudomonas sp. C32]
MSNSPLETVLCRYLYDPLDRQTDCTLPQLPAIQRFNCKDQLTTEIQGNARRSILQCDNQLLAQLNDLDAERSTTLLATDQQRSVLNALDANQPNPLAYSPYGHRPALNGLLSLLGFNGERPDPVTGHYHLGNGYRQFNPVLMRFNSPDSWSPFGEGGVNAYAYCEGDPRNRNDATGHFPNPLKGILNIFGRTPRKTNIKIELLTKKIEQAKKDAIYLKKTSAEIQSDIDILKPELDKLTKSFRDRENFKPGVLPTYEATSPPGYDYAVIKEALKNSSDLLHRSKTNIDLTKQEIDTYIATINKLKKIKPQPSTKQSNIRTDK